MKLLTTLLIIGSALVCSTIADKFEPSVAFVCDRGAVHMHEDGTWLTDPKTDCMEGKSEILDYCKKMYPGLDITNIVESSEYKHIKGWCALGKADCGTSEAFKVRPFRCLTGPFQSDALIVPKGCTFDHVHQPKQCHGFDWWSDVAHKACRGIKHMKTDNFAMLLPCGTDVFTGVEYVCCPDGSNSTAEVLKVEEDKPVVEKPQADQKPVISVKVESAPKAEVASSEDKVVDNYLHMKGSAYKENEHEAYNLAKKELTKVSHEKITKLMKDWAEARKRVLTLKAIDPKGAEKMNKEITPRFQKEYFALQTSSASKLLQMDSVHQQHVQTNLDVKKRTTVEKLMHELQADQPEPALITKLLKRYISIEEKDAHHCIHHYTKIRGRDTSEARDLLPVTLTHLTLISARINQSISLLDSLDSDSMRTKIVTEVQTWRSKTFNSINKYISTFKEELHAHPATKPPRTTELPKTVKDSLAEKEPVIKVVEKKPVKPEIQVSESKPTKASKGMYKQYAEKFAMKSAELKPSKPSKKFDEEDEKEKEHSNKMVNSPKVQVSHLAKGLDIAVHSNSFSSQAVSSSSMTAGATVAIAVGSVAGVMVVILAIILVRKKVEGKPSKDSYLEVSVEDNMSAEDKHIASMQNGYENPTYRYLEKQSL